MMLMFSGRMELFSGTMVPFSGTTVLFSGTMLNALGGELELLETLLGDNVIVIPEPQRQRCPRSKWRHEVWVMENKK